VSKLPFAKALVSRLSRQRDHARRLHRGATDKRTRSELHRLAIELAEISATLRESPSRDARFNACELSAAAAILLRQLEATAAPELS
jgi:hypothetical protein